MKINRDFYVKLDKEKKELIEKTYYSLKGGSIQYNDFIDICKSVLDTDEYDQLFFESEETNITSKPQREETYDDRGDEKGDGREEKKKKDNIDDVMHYTGIDLKEEADNITKDLDYVGNLQNVGFDNTLNGFDDMFNVNQLTKFINSCCINRNVKITEDAVNLIFNTLYRKIRDLLDKLNEASKLRTNTGVLVRDMGVLNEHSKQLWYLNEYEKELHLKLNLKKEEERQKRKQVTEREDLVIKKRQSNTVAMAAMGIKQKSWMKHDSQKDDDINRFEQLYAQIDYQAFEKQQDNRIITVDDLIYVLEKDKRFSKSVFLLQLKFLTK
ncbi:hypothetical protein A0H76_2382 [Hepatospora eriocheir]|uniref:Transcription initiation factor TFIID subunit 4 n=1 Tax=Hepatospora eriocheir TaxID=1081669 RepID=A0A1X0QLD9_9MICR|nr:hypothetical protein A0H76_2382 [Hepatospora eriocheir]